MEYFIFSAENPEIAAFLEIIFEIQEVRGRVGKKKGIAFVIHTNEHNHFCPHVHASYGEYDISIDIETGKVFAGNLPAKNQKMAVNWVRDHKEKLLHDWNSIALSADSSLTTTALNKKSCIE